MFRFPPPYLWTPPTPQRVKGCTPLTILKKKSKHKKASAAPVGAIALTLFSLLHLKPLSRCATAPPRGSRRARKFCVLAGNCTSAAEAFPQSGEGGAQRRMRVQSGSASSPRCAFAESGAAAAVSLHDPTRENAMPERPQTLRHCSIKNNLSAEYGQSNAEAIQNRPTRKLAGYVPPPFLCPQSVVY